MSYRYLVSIDPSLSCSGWALFAVDRQELVAVGKIRSLPSEVALASRFSDLQAKITEMFRTLDLNNQDILICEAPTTMRDPKAAFKVEQVRGIFETIARTKGLAVPGRLNPRSVQYEVLGLKGRQLSRIVVKQAATTAVQAIFGDQLKKLGFLCDLSNLKKHQDIVDAILVGNLALSRIIAAQVSSIPVEEIFMAKSKIRSGKQLVR